jgi:hypothetical protein
MYYMFVSMLMRAGRDINPCVREAQAAEACRPAEVHRRQQR